METCSLSGIGTVSCGESRGACTIITLKECQEDIRGHLANCHLSRSYMKEYELILARAGLFNLTEEQVSSMTVCPTHRNTLGRFRRPRTSCQYPTHSSAASRVKGRNVFNVQISEDVLKLYGVLIQVGSRKNFIHIYHYFYILECSIYVSLISRIFGRLNINKSP